METKVKSSPPLAYDEALAKTFPLESGLLWRLHLLCREFPGTMWNGSGHRARYEHTLEIFNVTEPETMAAAYLVSSSKTLYVYHIKVFAENRLEESGKLSKDDLALAEYVNCILLDSLPVITEKLGEDRSLLPNLFRLIVNALLVLKLGAAALGISDAYSKDGE